MFKLLKKPLSQAKSVTKTVSRNFGVVANAKPDAGPSQVSEFFEAKYYKQKLSKEKPQLKSNKKN
jgi:hypothetical protein